MYNCVEVGSTGTGKFVVQSAGPLHRRLPVVEYTYKLSAAEPVGSAKVVGEHWLVRGLLDWNKE